MSEIKRAMDWLGAQPHTVFLGQSVGCSGTTMYASLADIDPTKRTELPVAEELQLGMGIGLSLEGYLPILVYPRFNFLLRATDQLVNHLDRLPIYSGYRPKVIIRTAVGSTKPLDPGPQHQFDFSDAFRAMLKTVKVVQPRDDEIFTAYQEAFRFDGSTIVVEGAFGG